MLQFKNPTGLAGTIFASPDADGIDSLYTVIKGTFDLTDGLRLADEQVPVTLAAEHYGDPLTSSIRVPADTSLMKPATDVLLVGSAHAPGGRPVTWMDVWLAAGPVQKVVRVIGDRRWHNDGMGFSSSEPAPFTTMPLVWELAYGGSDVVDGQPVVHPWNPVGRGFRTPHTDLPIEGRPLPNLEDPKDPISGWKQAIAPACFATVAPHWEPRRSFAGTYDETWQQSRAPYLPKDFDPRFFQLAPPGLVVPGYLRGGEMVQVQGATPNGTLSFQLPEARMSAAYVVNGTREERPAVLDTVIIDTRAMRLMLVWRSVLACDKKLLRVSEVQVELAAAA
jgi:hypothetical protein